MFGFSALELGLVLLIVLFIFGPKRLKNIGSDLGSAIKGFRTAVADEDKPAVTQDEKVIDGSVAHKESAETKQKSDAA